MKPLILAATVICSSAFAAESVTTATSASEPKAAPPAATSFCGQDVMQRLFLKTEIGKQLQLRQRDSIRQAMLQAVNEGKISVQEYMLGEYAPVPETQETTSKAAASALPASKEAAPEAAPQK